MYGNRVTRPPWGRRWAAGALALLALGMILYRVPTGYYLVTPGIARDVSELVRVNGEPAGGDAGKGEGSFLLVTVGARPANALAYLYGRLDPTASLLPRDALPSEEENRRLMEESQRTAARLALGAAGALVAPDVHVEFKVDDITGPSAGLMFALEIVDQLTPGDLTGGRVVAGTGGLDASGRVLPVGSVKQKLIAARNAGARVFILPLDNEGEAQGIVGLRVVPVASLAEALDFLDGF